jgi:phage terminase large subunit-like protein
MSSDVLSENAPYITKKKKTVDDYLNDVDYRRLEKEMPSDFALEFINFIKLVNGSQGEENESPLLHYKMLKDVDSKEKRTLNMVFRGGAKTSIFGEYMFLYLGVYGRLPVFGKIDLALYVSDSIENGVKNMRKNLEYRWENSKFLREFIPKTIFTDTRWEFRNADGNIFIVKGYGAKTGVRGSKELGKRPTLAVLDDLLSDDDARSDTVINSIEDTVYKAITYALHPTHYKIIWSGTPFNAKDPLHKAVEAGSWHNNVYPVCEKFPCTREEFRGAWEDRFPYDYVMGQYTQALEDGKIDTFNQELMLRIMSTEDRLILDEDIKWYRRELVLRNKSAFNFYITSDFATQGNAGNDYSVIFVWAYSHKGYWFWVDGICRRQHMGQNINDLFHFASNYQPQQVGIEVSGQQGGFIPWIEEQMVARNIWFPLASERNSTKPGLRPSTNKLQRLNVVVPWFKAGMMWFPVEMKTSEPLMELMSELALVSPTGIKSKNDDAIDGTSQLGSLTPYKPSYEVPMHETSTSTGVTGSGQSSVWEEDVDDDGSSMNSYLV